VPVTFDAYMRFTAKRPDNIYTGEPFPAPYIPDCLPAGGAGVFPLQTGVYPAFIDINAFGMRYPS